MSLAELIPHQFRAGAEKTASALRKADDILIAAHINPDGDAIGAMLACAAIVERLDKKCLLYIPQGIPGYLDFLPVSQPVYRDMRQLPFAPVWAVFLDCSQLQRLGAELSGQPNHWHIINVDHHICDAGLGTAANFINTGAAATCQLMAYVAMALNMPLRGNLAEAIGVGLLTDTGCFRHGNTTAEVFELAALLEREGLRLHKLAEKLQDSMSLNRLMLFGALFSKARLLADGKLACGVVYQEDLRQHGCSHEDLEGLVDWLRKIKGVKIAMLMRELENGHCKFSLRSSGETDVQGIAARLGGGGHKNAAGGTLECSPAEGVDLLQKAVDEYYRSRSLSS